MTSFVQWWQTMPSRLDPIIFSIGSFQLGWYGMMYLAGFALTWLLALSRLRRETGFSINKDQLANLMSTLILGLIVGARLGYIVFYNLQYFLQHPLEIILPFDISNGWRFVGISGMSYHGGLIGTIFFSYIYLRRQALNVFETAEFIIPCIPLGYTFGRLGNFINGELWGRTTDGAIGMYFPNAPGSSLRHPSQLYEAFFEGLVLWVILWILKNRITRRRTMLALYLLGYGFFRFLIEYTREPDAHLGFVLLRLSMGQVLCLAMMAVGAILLLVPKQWLEKSIKPAKTGKKVKPSK